MSTTVYLVWEMDFENQVVLSVWSSRVAADLELERIKSRGFSYGYEVTEHVLDEPHQAAA